MHLNAKDLYTYVRTYTLVFWGHLATDTDRLIEPFHPHSLVAHLTLRCSVVYSTDEIICLGRFNLQLIHLQLTTQSIIIILYIHTHAQTVQVAQYKEGDGTKMKYMQKYIIKLLHTSKQCNVHAEYMQTIYNVLHKHEIT